MKPTQFFLALFITATTAVAADVSPLRSVFVIDDQTGPELRRKHGIEPLTTGDFDVLINRVLRSAASVRLMHQAVDGNAADNPVTQILLRSVPTGDPPKRPASGLPLRQLAQAVSKYKQDRARWQARLVQHRHTLVDRIEQFISDITASQKKTAARMAAELERQGGKDIPRSDICGCVAMANRTLGSQGQRFLILNSDAQDLPSHRAPRTKPLTPAQLDPDIHLVFVNTSRTPEKSPLFKGVPNPIHHADSLPDAMDLITRTMK